jgi:pilus assembly protein CpaF
LKILFRIGSAMSTKSERAITREQIFAASLDYFLDPIKAFLQDDTVTEIMVNGHDEIYIERQGQLQSTNARFESPDTLLSAVHNIAQYVGREIDELRPILDARLPNGSRVHAVIPPSARRGTYLTIRKFSKERLTLDDLLSLGSISESAKEFLELCVRLHKNIIVSGGTGTGKTSLLNALSEAIPEEERVVVIEDSSELKLSQKHCLYLESQQGDSQGRGKLTIRQLFVASLRMRPDRILVGEVRGGEALDMIQSMLSGHSGSLTTVHANSAHDSLIRLETLSLMSDVSIPVYVARAQVASAIHLVVQISRFSEDGSRKIVGISEIVGLKNGEYQIQDLYVARRKGLTRAGRIITELESVGVQPTFTREVYEQGLERRVEFSRTMWDLQPG